MTSLGADIGSGTSETTADKLQEGVRFHTLDVHLCLGVESCPSEVIAGGRLDNGLRVGIDQPGHSPLPRITFPGQGGQQLTWCYKPPHHSRLQNAQRIKLWQAADALHADINHAQRRLGTMDNESFSQRPAVIDAHMDHMGLTQYPEISVRCGADACEFRLGTGCDEEAPRGVGQREDARHGAYHLTFGQGSPEVYAAQAGSG
ncbi:hypothetical protein [Arthrobacter sp. CAN_A1]|uniref:hypothetical protein n=1 Tax=Arthrobacter sp. CAN_A1 TaxID=2787717 RepID=UPI0018CBA70D